MAHRLTLVQPATSQANECGKKIGLQDPPDLSSPKLCVSRVGLVCVVPLLNNSDVCYG